jgi:hypothetical protein
MHLLLSALNNKPTCIFSNVQHTVGREKAATFSGTCKTTEKQWMAQHHYCMLYANSFKLYAGPFTSANHGQCFSHCSKFNNNINFQYLNTFHSIIKVHTRTGHEVRKVKQGYSSSLYISAWWKWVVNITPQPIYLQARILGIVQVIGWAPGPAWMGVKYLSLPGLNPKATQPIPSCYTNLTTPTPSSIIVWHYTFTQDLQHK